MNASAPKLAIVLGGGGIKPYAALPLISFLQTNRIPVDRLVGCSGGSIIAGLWAAGYTPDRIIHEVVPRLSKSIFKTNWRAVLALANLPFCRIDRKSTLIKPEGLRKLFREFWGDTRLEDLNPKTIIQVTDFLTGEGLGMERGLLRDCVYASSAVYPYLPPLRMDDRLLFDGIYSAPIPVLQAARYHHDLIVVVEFHEGFMSDPQGPLEALTHITRLYAKTITAGQMALSIDLCRAEIIYLRIRFNRHISFWNIEELPLILDAGRQALEPFKEEFLMVYRQKSASLPSI